MAMLAALSLLTVGFASVPVPPVCKDNSAADPPVPGVLQGKGENVHVLLGMAPDYPPYTSFTDDVPKDLGGFSVEFAKLMEPECGIKVDFVLIDWAECWTSSPMSYVTEYVGNSIFNGYVHGCTSYTHTKGERGLSLEFTHSYLGKLKTVGVLTRLNNGVPIVSPMTTNYTGIKLGDVTGWAPTPDTFAYNKNYCVEGHPQFVKEDPIITNLPNGNEAAITALKDGTIDALYIYADQMYNYIQTSDALATGFGTDFAYIQTGLDQSTYNGTTLAISKRGSGLADVLNPCIDKVVQTQAYRDVCESFFDASSCIGSDEADTTLFYDVAMDERADTFTCADGYCTCDGV